MQTCIPLFNVSSWGDVFGNANRCQSRLNAMTFLLWLLFILLRHAKITNVFFLFLCFKTHLILKNDDIMPWQPMAMNDQLASKSLLYICINFSSLYSKYLTDCAQRNAFLETRRSMETRYKIEKENTKQVSIVLQYFRDSVLKRKVLLWSISFQSPCMSFPWLFCLFCFDALWGLFHLLLRIVSMSHDEWWWLSILREDILWSIIWFTA